MNAAMKSYFSDKEVEARRAEKARSAAALKNLHAHMGIVNSENAAYSKLAAVPVGSVVSYTNPSDGLPDSGKVLRFRRPGGLDVGSERAPMGRLTLGPGSEFSVSSVGGKNNRASRKNERKDSRKNERKDSRKNGGASRKDERKNSRKNERKDSRKNERKNGGASRKNERKNSRKNERN